MKKLMLLTGIENYPTAPIQGPLYDIRQYSNTFTLLRNFKSKELIQVTNESVTAKNVLTYLEQVIDLLQPGDLGGFVFSGHGAQVPTLTPELEVDGFDECLCTHDFDWTPDRMIRDKQLHNLLKKIRKGVMFLVILDACHSGDMERAMPFFNQHLHKRYEKTFPMTSHQREIRADAWRRGVRPQYRMAIPDEPLNVAIISGCRDNQVSLSDYFDGHYSGVLSHYLIDTMKREQPSVPITHIGQELNKTLKQNNYAQEPQLAGSQVSGPLLWTPEMFA